MSHVYRRVMAAVDGTQGGVGVARAALHLAAGNGAALCLAHAVDSLDKQAANTNLDALAASVKNRLEAELAEVLAEARACPTIPSVELMVAAGPVAETLTGVLVPRFAPDLVVCGKRGFSKVHYLIVGSVSSHLIRQLRCDVLVVKP